MRREARARAWLARRVVASSRPASGALLSSVCCGSSNGGVEALAQCRSVARRPTPVWGLGDRLPWFGLHFAITGGIVCPWLRWSLVGPLLSVLSAFFFHCARERPRGTGQSGPEFPDGEDGTASEAVMGPFYRWAGQVLHAPLLLTLGVVF